MTFRTILAFLTLCATPLFFGANQIEWSLLPTLNEKAWLPIIASRLPRLVALILTGSGLAMCGVILQHIAIIRTVMLSATADF